MLCAALKAGYDLFFRFRQMDTLGLGLIVGGAALLCSGLIFLLPRERKAVSSQPSVDGNIEEIEGNLRQLRKERGEES